MKENLPFSRIRELIFIRRQQFPIIAISICGGGPIIISSAAVFNRYGNVWYRITQIIKYKTLNTAVHLLKYKYTRSLKLNGIK